MDGKTPKLLDRVRQAIRGRHYSRRTEEAYLYWIRRYIVFHGKVHPAALGAADLSAFLSWLAEHRQVSASTQNQALSAVLFLYKAVLAIEIGGVPPVVRARTPERLPVVLSRDEVTALLKPLAGTMRLVVTLLYGAGLRLEECLTLRVKDLDFDRHQIIVRQGKGRKDRMTMLPAAAREGLTVHLADVRRMHDADLARGFGRVVLPFALDRKFPTAATEWGWQFVFPATRICRDLRFGPPSRYHLHESVVQKAVAHAARVAGIVKRVGPQTRFRDAFARSGV
jgi:integron integrase